MSRSLRLRLAPALLLLLLAPAVWATWSIVAVDTATGEVAVACATCIGGIDLELAVPVIRPEFGAAAAQSFVDGGQNRRRIWDRLALAYSPEDILQFLSENDVRHQSRQYGMADLAGRTLSFSGHFDGAWAGGVTGQAGTVHYAIQGNVLTGEPVVLQAEAAFLGAGGDLSERLMAAMEAARSMGGDGRCSCSQIRPTQCGSPPPQFDKSAHVGFLIVSRPGDAPGVCSGQTGCANGDYYLNLNIAHVGGNAPDPVVLLQQDYAAWRTAMAGRPDAVRSTVSPAFHAVDAGSPDPVVFLVELADLEGTAIQHGGAAVSVEHDPRSAGLSVLHSVSDHGDGTYTVTVTPGAAAGLDRLRIVVDDGIRPAVLWPPVQLLHRPAPQAPFNDLEPVPGLDDPAALDRHGHLLADGLTAYLLSTRDGRPKRLMRAVRPAPDAAFGPAADVPGLNDFDGRFSGFWISDDELRIIFSALPGLSGGEHLYAAERDAPGEPFGPVRKLVELNSPAGEGGPSLSPDECRIVFHSRRPGSVSGGSLGLWQAERPSPDAHWYPPRPVAGVGTAADESYPVLAEGGTRLLFSRSGPGMAEDLCFADLVEPGLFAMEVPLPGSAHRPARTAVTDLNAGGLWISAGDARGARDLLRAARTTQALTASGDFLSAAAGGVLDFSLDAGPAWAGAFYRMVLGGSGPVPGLRQGSAVLPLAADSATAFSLRRPDQPPFSGFRGRLDALGAASARIDLPPGAPLKASALGRDYLAAFLVLDGPRAFASNAVPFRLDP